MADEYKKLYASLEVLGAAIKKAEEHLKRSPLAHELFVDITKTYRLFIPAEEERDEDFVFTLRFCLDDDSLLHELSIFLANDPELPEDSAGSFIDLLSDCGSDLRVALAKYIPELISLADRKVEDLAARAENYAGEIEQALAMAAKKPERKPKKKS